MKEQTNSEKLKMQKRRYRENSGTFEHKRRAWTREEDILVDLQEMSDRELAELLDRSLTSIQIRRSRIRSPEYIEIQKRMAKAEQKTMFTRNSVFYPSVDDSLSQEVEIDPESDWGKYLAHEELKEESYQRGMRRNTYSLTIGEKVDEDEGIEEMDVPFYHNIQELCENNELREILEKALNKLTKKQAKRIRMLFFDQLTHRQIAKIEGCDVRAIFESIQLGLKKLKIILESTQQDPLS